MYSIFFVFYIPQILHLNIYQENLFIYLNTICNAICIISFVSLENNKSIFVYQFVKILNNLNLITYELQGNINCKLYSF